MQEIKQYLVLGGFLLMIAMSLVIGVANATGISLSFAYSVVFLLVLFVLVNIGLRFKKYALWVHWSRVFRLVLVMAVTTITELLGRYWGHAGGFQSDSGIRLLGHMAVFGYVVSFLLLTLEYILFVPAPLKLSRTIVALDVPDRSQRIWHFVDVSVCMEFGKGFIKRKVRVSGLKGTYAPASGFIFEGDSRKLLVQAVHDYEINPLDSDGVWPPVAEAINREIRKQYSYW